MMGWTEVFSSGLDFFFIIITILYPWFDLTISLHIFAFVRQ